MRLFLKNKSYPMKKAILLFVSVLFVYNGFSQNVNNGSSENYTIRAVVVDSARKFEVNYSNGEKFRKILMLTWGHPVKFTAGTIEWNPLSLQDIGDNVIITLTDGYETSESNGVEYIPFTDDHSKYRILTNLQSNQKRKFILLITNQQGVNIVTSKSIEKAVVRAVDQIVNSW
jgi:hypothetical protein